jgi:hypothetical protein
VATEWWLILLRKAKEVVLKLTLMHSIEYDLAFGDGVGHLLGDIRQFVDLTDLQTLDTNGTGVLRTITLVIGAVLMLIPHHKLHTVVTIKVFVKIVDVELDARIVPETLFDLLLNNLSECSAHRKSPKKNWCKLPVSRGSINNSHQKYAAYNSNKQN